MTTVYVQSDSLGKITGVYWSPQAGLALSPHDDQEPAIAKYLRDPLGLEEAFPALKKWQLWLTALQLGTPVTKQDVYQAIAAMPLSEFEKEGIRIMIEDVTEYHREDPRINLLATAMGLTPAEMDSLWMWAAQMEVPDVG